VVHDEGVRDAGAVRRAAQQLVRGGRRRPEGARQRLAHRQPQESDDDEEDEDAMEDVDVQLDGKIGAKKQRKLEEKAARKAQREAELQGREERKKQEEVRDKLRKKEELRKEAEEAAKEEEEKRHKEEKEKEEHEQYLQLKKDFIVEGEGVDAIEENEMQSLLQEFIAYIKSMKVVMLEDLAAHFKIKTQDAIDRIGTLLDEGVLSGVIDDRGKFVYITADEYEAVARFIKQRGRVSISELSESMNRLINLSGDSSRLMNSSDELSVSELSVTC